MRVLCVIFMAFCVKKDDQETPTSPMISSAPIEANNRKPRDAQEGPGMLALYSCEPTTRLQMVRAFLCPEDLP